MKLLILALDGFDPNLFSRWRDQLPNLSLIADQGEFHPVASTLPPMTFPAWSSFLTGVNPGKHGIFDFTERLPGRLAVRFVNATRRRYPTFLRLASAQGLSVGSIGLPTTYPPEPLSGYQIAGFDTPLPSRADPSYVFPRELAAKIERRMGGYYFGDFNESRIGRRWHRRVLKKLAASLQRKRDLVRFLQKEIPVDLLLVHVGETDTVGHHFWSFCDPGSPRRVPSCDLELADAIQTIYRSADDLVGDLMRACQPEAAIVISDHGMGGASDRMVYLNRFLAEKGFLRFSKSPSWSPWMGKLKTLGMKRMPYRLQQQFFKVASGSIASRIESLQRFSGIDWSNTVAYSEELNYFPAIYLNLQGREPLGVVSPERTDGVLNEIQAALLTWRDPADGSAIVRAVHRRDEIYFGPEIAFAPDLILELNQPDGYSYGLGKSADSRAKFGWRRLDASEYVGYKGASMNGSHRQHGTFVIAADAPLSPIQSDFSLLDLAPTILSLLDIPIPTWMDGRSLLAGSKTGPDMSVLLVEDYPYSPQQERNLQKRLIDLGYLG